MKASDIIKKKGKTESKGKKEKSSSLIDWIGKRRAGAKKTAAKGKERDEDEHEY